MPPHLQVIDTFGSLFTAVTLDAWLLAMLPGPCTLVPKVPVCQPIIRLLLVLLNPRCVNHPRFLGLLFLVQKAVRRSPPFSFC